MNRALQLAGVVLLVVSPEWCADQNKEKPAPPPKTAPKNFNTKTPNGGGVPKKGAPRINNPGIAQRLLQMTPEQREQALEKFNPQQQAQVRQQLERLDKLSQAQKDHIARQARALDSLPPEKHRIVTQQLRAFNKLPDDRIQPVRRELLQLMKMPEEQRNARLNSDEFKKQYSATEQSILSDLSQNLPLDYLPGR
jgi:hypothetical protein